MLFKININSGSGKKSNREKEWKQQTNLDNFYKFKNACEKDYYNFVKII